MTVASEAAASCMLLDDAAALRGCRDELAQLAETPGVASSIVQHPDWLLFELQSRGPSVTPCVVIARHPDGRLLGYACFLNEISVARIAFGAAHVSIYRGGILRLLGAGVVARPDERAMAEQIISASLRQDPALRVLRIQETELPNPLATALSHGAGRFSAVHSHLLEQINWTIPPQASLATYLAQLGPRRKKLAYAQRNVYKKLGPDAQLRVVEAAADIDDYCRLLNEVYANSWHAGERPLDWELPARRELFRQLAQAGQLCGHLLMLGTQPIAYVHGYRLAGRYLLDDTGYDEAFAALGIGSVLVFQAVQDLIERHPDEVIDFGYGDNLYKRVLATRQTPCGSLYLVRGLGARALFSLIAPLRWSYRRLRGVRKSWLSKTAA